RRRRRGRPGAAGRRAAHERHRRRGAGHRLRRAGRRHRAGRGFRARRPGPGTATLEAFSDLGLDLVPGNGLLAACVPAAFGTWLLLVQRHGRLPLREVMKYAIGYARDGYPVTAGVSAGIAAAGPLFREYWPTSAEVYLG